VFPARRFINLILRYVCSKQAKEIAARDGNFPIDAALAARECAVDGLRRNAS
jgi:hypothetical protein